MKRIEAKDKLIFALDVQDLERAITLLDQVEGRVGVVKVNSLAARFPEIVHIIHERGISVWRDWKHHDIPGTVSNFITADLGTGVEITTVHTLGGVKMMEYAAEVAKGTSLEILGITILTSHDQESFNYEIGIPGRIQDKVKDLALKAEKAGLSGVVCSPKEAEVLRNILDQEILIVTPGITPTWAVKREDQARVNTPKKAIIDGADRIVVGSAIHKNKNPGEAADKIVAEIEEGLERRC